MKIHIHPKYIHLKEAIAKIPEGGYEPLRTFCNSRNIVEQINIGDCAFVVKSYKVPNFANRIIYSFFRRSKAHRGNAEPQIRRWLLLFPQSTQL